MADRKWLLAQLLTLICFGVASSAKDTRRPFYVIAHMVNSVDDIEGVLKAGANALETDVSFQSDGRPFENFHGFPCDWWRYCGAREKFTDYLNYLRLRGTPGSPVYNSTTVSLLYLDLKVRDLSTKSLKRAGKFLAQTLVNHLFGNGTEEIETPWLIVGLPDIKHATLLKSMKKTLQKSGNDNVVDALGVDFYYAANIDSKFDAMSSFNVTIPLWLGEGHTNWWSPNYNRLEMLVNLARGTAYSASRVPTLVYHWTVDGETSLRHSLQFDIDAVITNTPDILYHLLKHKDFSDYFRLAKKADVPGEFSLDAGDGEDYDLE